MTKQVWFVKACSGYKLPANHLFCGITASAIAAVPCTDFVSKKKTSWKIDKNTVSECLSALKACY